MLEIAHLEGVELVFNQAKKHPNNPLFTPGEPGSFDDQAVFNHGSVIFEEGRFRMWYGGWAAGADDELRTGYAESKDGLKWTRVNVDSSKPSLGRNGNLVPDLTQHHAYVYKDDRDPSRRYKVITYASHVERPQLAAKGEYDLDASWFPGRLYFSADGLKWKSEPSTIEFPDGTPGHYWPQCVFYDSREPAAARRWKSYGTGWWPLRRYGGYFAYSADGKKWLGHPRNPVLPSNVRGVPVDPAGPGSQLHDFYVWPYEGYYLSLIGYQYDGVHVDTELAVSRDGEHFCHVKPGQKVIPMGAPGAWDTTVRIEPTVPIIVGNEMWLYYLGVNSLSENDKERRACAGLATLRLNGFTHIQLQRGTTTGKLTTVPFVVKEEGKPLHLVLNAECTPTAGLAVEVLDAQTGQPLPGYSRKDCEPFQGNSVRHVVRWGKNDRLVLPAGKRVSFRLWFEGRAGSPKLYEVRFDAAKG